MPKPNRSEPTPVWADDVHAMAGQRLVPRTGLTGMLARELLDEVPLVLVELRAD